MFQAEIIAIGDELLSGELVDTNSNYLDSQLERIGYRVVRHQTVPDQIDAIVEALVLASSRAQVIITTGGLGPTLDDRTFEALASALGVELEFHEATYAHLVEKFARFSVPTPNNKRQAMIPQGAEVLANDVGTAPGLKASLGDAMVFCLPGVSREMRWLFANRIIPHLSTKQAPVRLLLRVVGVGESRLEHEIRDIIDRHDKVSWGFLTHLSENHVKLLADGADAQQLVDAAEAEVRSRLGTRIYGADDFSLEQALVELLKEKKQTVAVAESCTGGGLGQTLTDVPGVSSVFLGGVVAYADQVKSALLGVSVENLQNHGAVSEPVACQMASGVRDKIGSDWGVALTGVAGPGGGTEEKPVGTVWLAIAGPAGVEAKCLSLRGNRTAVRKRSVTAAMTRLREHLLDLVY